MRRLFVSYARPERVLVEALVIDLRRAGYDAFFDEQLTGGQMWWEQLLTHIEQCDAFVPALSRTYVNSLPCRREADYAHGLRKPFLPVMLETMNPAECADYIADAHCVTYVQGDSNAAIDLMRALMELPSCPALPEPMPERPEIPVTYIAAAIRSAKDRVESPSDLPRADQVVLLSDLKTLLAGPHAPTGYELLREFQTRTDLTVQVANEIHSLLPQDQPQTHTDIGRQTPPPEPDPPDAGRARVRTAQESEQSNPTTHSVLHADTPVPRSDRRVAMLLGRIGAIAAMLCSAALIGVLVTAPWFYDSNSDVNRAAVFSPSAYPTDYDHAFAIVAVIASAIGLLSTAARLRTRRRPRRGSLAVLARLAIPGLAILALYGVIASIISVQEPPGHGWHALAVAISIAAVIASTAAATLRPVPREHPR